MQEKQLEALMAWVDARAGRAANPECPFTLLREMELRALTRNHFGFHQHEDHSGSRLHDDYDGEPHGTEEG